MDASEKKELIDGLKTLQDDVILDTLYSIKNKYSKFYEAWGIILNNLPKLKSDVQELFKEI